MRGFALGAAWVATAAAAFVAGRSLFPAAQEGGPSGEAERLRAEVSRLEAALAAGGGGAPSLRPGDRSSAVEEHAAAVRAAAGRDPAAGAAEGSAAPLTLDLEGVTTPDEALRRLLAFAEAKLAAGPKGHLELLAALDGFARNDQAKRLFDDETSASRVVYPLLKFAVTHEGQVVALTETVFQTMAEDPAALAGLDDDTLEIFTEGFAVALPGAVDEATLGRFRAYGRKILDTPEASQPDAVRKNRRDLEQAMGLWAPLLSSSEAAERLRRGDASGQEVLALLKRVAPEDLEGLDVGALLGPLVESGDARAVWGLRRLSLDSRAVAALDDRLIAGASAGKLQGWTVPSYLDATRRTAWADARPLFDRGLARGEKATETFATALANLREPPPPDYVQSVLATYTLSETVRTLLARVGGK